MRDEVGLYLLCDLARSFPWRLITASACWLGVVGALAGDFVRQGGLRDEGNLAT